VAPRLHRRARMDAADADRLATRPHDRRLVPGIYNYCDGRCTRCPFTDRCLAFRHALDANGSVAQASHAHDDDPLVTAAREYGRMAWPIAKALVPIAAARGDRYVIEIVATIDWFSGVIASKIYRAVAGEAPGSIGRRKDGEPPHRAHSEPQQDCDGSAKVALLGIDESMRAWRVLMDQGTAMADGIPARAVQILEDLAAATHRRFPRAMAFVRPGFDEPEIAAGGPAQQPNL